MIAETYTVADGIAEKLTEITASGKTGRGPSSLCRSPLWQCALDLISGRERISILSGFYVPSASAPETDGPPGAFVLARALRKLGHDVTIWTDSLCYPCFLECGQEIGFPASCIIETDGVKEPASTDLLLYIERLGRASDGRYYNMRGEDISAWTAPLDSYAMRSSVPTIAIGDGGNEVGMGNFNKQLGALMPGYADCLCAVTADVCIPVDVSNWGAYALTAALSSHAGTWLGQSDQEESLMLSALCRCGVVDGVSRKCEPSVDGMPLDEQQNIRSNLEKAIRSCDRSR